MRTKLSSRIALVVALVIGLGVGLTVLLNYFKLAQTLTTIVETRLAFIAHDVRSRIEAGLDLGLDLAALTNVEGIVDEVAANDPKILAITVFDATGHVLFGSGHDRMVAGSPVPEAWVRAAEQAADWRADAPDTLVVGSRLTNDFGTVSGGVALVYTRAPIDHLLKGALAVLVLVGAILVGLMTVLVRLIAAAMFRRTERRLLEMREGIEALMVPGDPSKPPPPAVDAAFAAAHERLGRILTDLDEASDGLAAIGRATA